MENMLDEHGSFLRYEVEENLSEYVQTKVAAAKLIDFGKKTPDADIEANFLLYVKLHLFSLYQSQFNMIACFETRRQGGEFLGKITNPNLFFEICLFLKAVIKLCFMGVVRTTPKKQTEEIL